LEYLAEFLSDLDDVMREGFVFNGKSFSVSAMAVCDAPARAAIKGVKQFSARHGCDFCEEVGQHDGKRVVWLGPGLPPRTDASFRQKNQKDHHKNDSPLLTLNMDMIYDVPLDFMHQAGGTMKKILLWMTDGPRRTEDGRNTVRLSASNIKILDDRLQYLKQFIPCVFSRKCRPTLDIPHYKYAVLCQLLLYTGKVVLKNITACEDQYDVFLLYSIACSLMADEDTAKRKASTHSRLMKEAVQGFPSVFGKGFMTCNAYVNLLPISCRVEWKFRQNQLLPIRKSPWTFEE
jgi:hypothetical protein